MKEASIYYVIICNNLVVQNEAIKYQNMDKVAFDSLMNKARAHASSCMVSPMLEPMDAVFLSILVEQEKEIISLRQSLQLSQMV